jgi:uncharacterized repeat protein (TIGR01451 family)
MSRWHLGFRLALLVLLILALVTPAAADLSLSDSVRAKIAPTLLRRVLQASPADAFRFLITVRADQGLDRIPAGASAVERRAAVVEHLQRAAQAGQARLLLRLGQLAEQEHVQHYHSFWIFNGLAVTGDREALLALAAHDDVVSIRPDGWQQWIIPDDTTSDVETAAGVDWGIAQIRADQVWSGLQIDGEGVVVATMDTGVDWNHPVLQPSYRGWHDGNVIHTGSWYDATGQGALYPVDGMGHGTHVTGLLAGQEGIGVAPGARWIAVRTFNNFGYGLDSWIHAGFQWLLAPAGDPALAPDIVSNSWSNPNGWNIEFRPDVQALVAAGILPVFAAGNSGPDAGSIGAPGSYPEALAVGACDPDDEVAYFSGRGPSPFVEIKPEIIAPGVDVLSALPGGAYGEMSGTSMATPLVAGVAALMRQADPALALDQIMEIITSTAVPVGASWPNTDAGWGRVDALAAVTPVANPGYLEGVVRGSGNTPLVGAAIRAVEHGGGATATTQTNADGRWSLTTAPGTYDLEATFFGYAPKVQSGVPVITGTITTQNFNLSPLPGGSVEGMVTSSDTSSALPAVVRATGTPVVITAGADGAFALELPAGTYTLTAEYWGYRVSQQIVNVTVGNTTRQDFVLEGAPTLLLVDSGAWYYGSEIGYFQTALDDLGYLYHDWRIKHLPQETPVITDLLPYDAVVWSSPADSPGYVDAGEVISGYLAAGGNLFLSGQDVGYWESGASGFFWSPYFRERLYARLLSDNSNSQTLYGTADGPLDGLTLTLNGPENADNQTSPDSVGSNQSDFSVPVLDYSSSGHGGLEVGQCLPYRAFYLSFGLEGMGARADRSEVMGRALEWLVSPRPTVGAELRPPDSDLIAPAGSSVTHTVRLRNTGEAGTGDTFTLDVEGADWPTIVLSPSITLSPCQTALINVRVDIPPDLGRDVVDQAILTAHSGVSPTLVSTAVLTTKTPAPILLVDDDRWYNQESVYRAALDAGGFRYDYWDARIQPSELLSGTLARYPLVVWFTGYDWYAPLTSREVGELEAYLARGGRVFLSSQDALYYQAESLLAQHYLGVLDHSEDVTPTLAYGAQGQLTLPSQMELDYPFRNFSDGVIPAEDATVELYADSGWAMGLSNLDRSGEGWKSIFLSFPFEALPAASQPAVMDQMVGWLGWLGESDYQVDDRALVAGNPTTFTATLRNDGPVSVTAVLSNPLPSSLGLIPGTLVGGELDGGVIRWEGTLPAGGDHTVRYAGTVSAALAITSTFYYAEHDLAFHERVQVWTDSPNLEPSTLTANPAVVIPGQPVTYTLRIHNSGPASAADAAADWTLPSDLVLLADTLQASGGDADLEGRLVHWEGSIASGEIVTLRLQALTFPGADGGWLSSAAVLKDGVTEVIVRGHVLELRPLRYYLPVMMR